MRTRMVVVDATTNQTPWWTADCIVISADDYEVTFEFVLEEDDPCEANTLYVSMRANAGKVCSCRLRSHKSTL